MKIHSTSFSGLYLVELDRISDDRGVFSKTFQWRTFESAGLATSFRECFYSRSQHQVIRGMHFQLPPHHQDKFVYVIEGEILDVALELRKREANYGHCYHKQLLAGLGLYIPAGMAHGFATLSDQAIVGYMTTSIHHPDSDTGILWNSFNFDWRVNQPILSERDQNFVAFADFESPF